MYNQKPLLGTLPNFAHPLTPNVAAWIMNEGSGNKIYDIIGGNHGTFGVGAAAPTWVPGKTGPALDFDGDDDYVNVSDNPTLDLNIMSIAILVKFTEVSDERFISKNNFEFIKANAVAFYVYSALPEGYFLTSTTAPVINTWYHVVYTYDGTTSYLYINGIKEDNDTGHLNWSNADDLKIGRAGFVLNGIIDDIKIYNRALNINEIQQLYINPYCWFAEPFQAELMYAAPPVGAIMNQFQKANIGADLYDGVLIT